MLYAEDVGGPGQAPTHPRRKSITTNAETLPSVKHLPQPLHSHRCFLFWLQIFLLCNSYLSSLAMVARLSVPATGLAKTTRFPNDPRPWNKVKTSLLKQKSMLEIILSFKFLARINWYKLEEGKLERKCLTPSGLCHGQIKLLSLQQCWVWVNF